MAYCGTRPGMCGRKVDCADRHCPGRAQAIELRREMRREMRRQTVVAARFCDGGERVSHGKTATSCHYCVNGICRSALSAEFYISEPEPTPARPSLFQRIAAVFDRWFSLPF